MSSPQNIQGQISIQNQQDINKQDFNNQMDLEQQQQSSPQAAQSQQQYGVNKNTFVFINNSINQYDSNASQKILQQQQQQYQMKKQQQQRQFHIQPQAFQNYSSQQIQNYQNEQPYINYNNQFQPNLTSHQLYNGYQPHLQNLKDGHQFSYPLPMAYLQNQQQQAYLPPNNVNNNIFPSPQQQQQFLQQAQNQQQQVNQFTIPIPPNLNQLNFQNQQNQSIPSDKQTQINPSQFQETITKREEIHHLKYPQSPIPPIQIPIINQTFNLIPPPPFLPPLISPPTIPIISHPIPIPPSGPPSNELKLSNHQHQQQQPIKLNEEFELQDDSDPHLSQVNDMFFLGQRSRSRSFDKKISESQEKQSSKIKKKQLSKKILENKIFSKQGYSLRQTDIQQQEIQIKQRTMNDIEGQSLNTSRHLLAQSFKWSSRLKSFSVTQKKGVKINFSINQIQMINSKNKNENLAKPSINLNSNSVQQKYTLNSSQLSNKGIHIKQAQLSKHQENQLHKIDENTNDNDDNNSNLSKQLQYDSNIHIQNTHTFNSVQKFAESVTLFKQKLLEHQQMNFTPDFKFYFHSNIDNGSFGQVDLYFFDQDEQKKKICFPEQPFLNNDIFSLENQSMNIESKDSVQMNAQNPVLFGKHSIASLSTQQFDSNSLQNSFQKETSGTFSTLENIKQQSNDIPKLIFPQIGQINQNNNEYMKDNQIINYLPAAGKKIKNFDEFIRELYIMQEVQCEYKPTLIGKDFDEQILYMELGLCNLYDLKQDSVNRKYKLSDEFTYSILINVICAIESLLSHIYYKTKEPLPLFHSDIKPQNIILTVKKDQNLHIPIIQLLLIDYGGASFEIEDYWTHYTPAFVCNKLWEKLVNGQNNQQFLTWEEIRYAEVYAACRSIQFIIIEQHMQSLFKKENINFFANKYEKYYPKTVNLLMRVFNKEDISKISNNYSDILSSEEISQHKIINPQNIIIESQKIFEISKLYNFFNSKEITNNL